MVSTLTCSAAFSACTSPRQTEEKRKEREKGRRGGGEEEKGGKKGRRGEMLEKERTEKEGKDQRGCTG